MKMYGTSLACLAVLANETQSPSGQSSVKDWRFGSKGRNRRIACHLIEFPSHGCRRRSNEAGSFLGRVEGHSDSIH